MAWSADEKVNASLQESPLSIRNHSICGLVILHISTQFSRCRTLVEPTRH